MPARLLIIDDDEDIRESLVSLLGAEGYDVVAAGDGQEAIRLLAQGPYSAIVLDLLMPTMNGGQFEAALQANPKWSATPVIVCSAGPIPQDIAERAFAALRKPFDLDRLLLLLKAACRAA